jgi:hypothetical protein
VVVIAYGNKLNEIQTGTMRDSFLILRNNDFVAKYFPCFLQTTILFNFKLEICRPKKLCFIYNNLSKADRAGSEQSPQDQQRRSKDETAEMSFESMGMRKDLKFNSFNGAFSHLIQGVQLSTESFVQQQYGELKAWPLIDLAFVLANRPLVDLGQSRLRHYKKDPTEPDTDPVNLQIFGFQEEYSLDFGVEFSGDHLGNSSAVPTCHFPDVRPEYKDRVNRKHPGPQLPRSIKSREISFQLDILLSDFEFVLR